jgi:hypothetical protein
MNSKGKILTKLGRLYDEEYCFGSRIDKYPKKGAQIYGTDTNREDVSSYGKLCIVFDRKIFKVS